MTYMERDDDLVSDRVHYALMWEFEVEEVAQWLGCSEDEVVACARDGFPLPASADLAGFADAMQWPMEAFSDRDAVLFVE